MKVLPAGYWKSLSNQRQFFDELSHKLNLNGLECWYKITTDEIHSRGGGGLLNSVYGGSLQRALLAVYPEYDWNPWEFTAMPKMTWSDSHIQRRFMDWIGRKLTIRSLEDWYF